MAGVGPGSSGRGNGRPQNSGRQPGLTSIDDQDASIAELQELYANLREHSRTYQGAELGGASPSAPVHSSRSGAGAARSDENSVGESLEEGIEDKKKKLPKDQVKELEAMFQSGYTGAPEGRSAIGKKMCITERQVAIWFQNRRARQRSKQLGNDFEMLKKDFRMVFLENQVMRKELAELRARVAETDPSGLLQAQPPLEMAAPAAPAYSDFRIPSPGKRTSLDRPHHPGGEGLRERQSLDDVEYLPRLKRARLYQSEGGPFPGGNFGHPNRSLEPEPGGLNRQPSSGLLDAVVAQANVSPLPGSGGLDFLDEREARQDLDAALLGPGHEGRLELGLRGNNTGWAPQRQFFDVLGNAGERGDELEDDQIEPPRRDRDPDGW
ncbi:homeobox protein [Klebsormidium nitens]|uniref:Homeobox protein n=1 Tax=Klebsormidium nitens TaxID=105231 RepID=A0A1Y1HS68_KLENI|nr:homeobox protein [Klebsormidium nitens]|eukprot:GAQ81475.1 homeobox protein [Klebsormidium nitens]